ncbi:SRPBCC family protein [Nonomuraea jabiensis]|uniref:Ribosome-associated toxin RatA of RatAB toxin-antitoxin module n=1 Tax=Nonomuraea jabiensis TaxID=882448 RepID=A0A7W9GG46_9ACTN|nr:SRPBCC family protein [Nonomuraea jabiensis]MBB5783214.1 ribosome-associated toxin RatA of RatAB toxin-antitoxin module [Nonomuraea jabiensis]
MSDVPSTTVRAPATTVLRLLTDVAAWPRVFPSVVHAEPIDGGSARVWWLRDDEIAEAVVGYDGGTGSVRFQSDGLGPPIGGTWTAEPLGEGESRLRGEADLEPVRIAAEEETGQPEVHLEFADTVRIAGAASDVYDFLHRVEEWPRVVPHVAAASARPAGPHGRFIEIDNAGPGGPVRTTEAVRVGFPGRAIVEKHRLLPPLATLHVLRWTIEESGGSVAVTAAHTVVIRPSGVAAVLGEGTTVAGAREWIRKALGGNSVVVAERARAYAEERAGTGVPRP